MKNVYFVCADLTLVKSIQKFIIGAEDLDLFSIRVEDLDCEENIEQRYAELLAAAASNPQLEIFVKAILADKGKNRHWFDAQYIRNYLLDEAGDSFSRTGSYLVDNIYIAYGATAKSAKHRFDVEVKRLKPTVVRDLTKYVKDWK